MSWHDLKVILHQSPASSALHRALYPPKDDDLWTTSLEPQLLALVIDGLNVNNYLLQRLGGNEKATYPEPFPRPGVTPNPGTEHIKGTPRPIEEMNQLLGWDDNNNNN